MSNLDQTQQTALANFQAMTECFDIDLGITLLIDAQWDEMKAVQNYMSQNQNQRSQTNQDDQQEYVRAAQPIRQDRLIDDQQMLNPFEYIQRQQMNQRHEEQIRRLYQQNQPSFLDSTWNYLKESIPGRIIGGIANGLQSTYRMIPIIIRRPSSGGEEFLYNLSFEHTRQQMQRFPNFQEGTFQQIQDRAFNENKCVFLYIRQANDLICKQLDEMLKDEDVRQFMNQNFLVFGLDAATREGVNIQNELSITQFPYICMIIIKKQRNNNQIRDCISNIAGQCPSKEALMEILVNALETQDFYNIERGEVEEEEKKQVEAIQAMLDQELRAAGVMMNSGPGASQPQQNTRMREQQRQELEQAQIDDMRRKEQQEQQLREQRQLEEEKAKQQEEIKQKQEQKRHRATSLKESLPQEPESGNPDSCEILFRNPQGNQKLSRRFLKTDTVELLYTYIDSIIDEIQFENEDAEYEIMQNMPKKVFNDRQKTLQQEGLYPRAMVLIHEK